MANNNSSSIRQKIARAANFNMKLRGLPTTDISSNFTEEVLLTEDSKYAGSLQGY